MKTKHQETFKSLAFLLSTELFNNCSTCGKNRKTVKFEDLPDASKNGFKVLSNQEPYKSGATFYHCRKCDEFSIVSSPFE